MGEINGIVREFELVHCEPFGVESLPVYENGEFPSAAAMVPGQLNSSCNRTEVIGGQEYAGDIIVLGISHYSLHLQTFRGGVHLPVAIVFVYYGLELKRFARSVGAAVGQQQGLPGVLIIIVRFGIFVHAESVAA